MPPRAQKAETRRFIAVDHVRCTGCKACETTCSLWHFGECNPARSAIRVVRKEKDGLVSCLPLVCQQCEPAPCLEACPTGALSRAGGVLASDSQTCTGCQLCVEACPAGCLRFDREKNAVISCDLCGEEPRCVLICHAGCLSVAESQQPAPGAARLAELLKGLGEERG